MNLVGLNDGLEGLEQNRGVFQAISAAMASDPIAGTPSYHNYGNFPLLEEPGSNQHSKGGPHGGLLIEG